MPVNVPDEPKKYTTVYDNFKGVDFTNDASNVYKRRSPTGKNMLPDLDGRPYKRTGWDIKFSKEDFITAAGLVGVTDIIPLRTHYFSYGGHDFIMVFNSIGVFWIRDDSDTPTLAELWDGAAKDVFPPVVQIKVDGQTTERQLTADHNRAFFFEGQGAAGFYVFVENDLYKFGEVTNQGYCFTKVEPTVPIVIIGADPLTHVGTVNQSLNMLTDRRTIEYFGDGSSTYGLTSEPLSEDTTKVEILNTTTGEWDNIAPSSGGTTRWRVAGSSVVFETNPPGQSNVGNVRITFTPKDGTSYSVTTGVETARAEYTVSKYEVYYRTKLVTTEYFYNKTTKKWVKQGASKTSGLTGWETSIGELVRRSAANSKRASTASIGVLSAPDVFNTAGFTVRGNFSNAYTDITSRVDLSWGAYNSTVNVKPHADLLEDALSHGTKKTTDGAWTVIGSSTVTGTGLSASGKTGKIKIVSQVFEQTRTVTTTKKITFYGVYNKSIAYHPESTLGISRDAFSQCRKVLNFGNDIYNQVFISASTADNYRNRAWYCAANDPTYFPELNYMEVGSDDKSIMGLQKVGSYLGIIKMGSGTEASVYLAYPTSFEEESTYAVKQSVSGIGAISTGAFNILNEEPLFLSERGVMGINVSETDSDKQIRNRSFYINKRLLAEKDLENAISFVFNGLYYLAINNRCYVLDGSQKTSWANEKTNLQYECYFLDNIPAQCFAKMGGSLYFSDKTGNLCFFKKNSDGLAYIDAYSVEGTQWIAATDPSIGEVELDELSGVSGDYGYLLYTDGGQILVYYNPAEDYDPTKRYDVGDYVFLEQIQYICTTEIDEPEEWTPAHWEEVEQSPLMVMAGEAEINDTVGYHGEDYTIIDILHPEEEGEPDTALVSKGVPISAEWSTIADDDGMVHFFKNLNKKGCVVSLLPDDKAYVDISIKADEKDEVNLGYADGGMTVLPADIFVKKKIKKYKRLQFICRNDWYNDSFALDQIIKTYTVGNYSKNRK